VTKTPFSVTVVRGPRIAISIVFHSPTGLYGRALAFVIE